MREASERYKIQNIQMRAAGVGYKACLESIGLCEVDGGSVDERNIHVEHLRRYVTEGKEADE